MPGKIFIFERDAQAAAEREQRRVAADATIAVTVAADGQSDICHEPLTDRHNPKPMIAVIFTETKSIETFHDRLPRAMKLCGVALRDVRSLEP